MPYLTIAAGIVAAAFVGLVLRRPVVGGVLMLFILYTRISDVGITYHGLPSIAQPLVLILAGTMCLRRTAGGGARGLGALPGVWSAMCLYLAVLFASTVWAADSGAAVKVATDFAKNLLIVYVIVETFETPRSLRIGIWILIAAGALLGGLTVLQAMTHTYGNSYFGLAQAPVRQITGGINSERSSGPIGDPNFYALILVVLLPLAVMRVRDEREPLLRWAAAAAALLMVDAMILTYSRGGLLTLVAIAVLYVLLTRIRISYLALGILVLIPVLVVVPGGYWQRIATVGTGLQANGQTDASVQKRIASEQVAIEMFSDNPIGGVGAGNYPNTYFPYALRLQIPAAANYAHDLYLQIAAETGLIGLVTFLGAILLTLLAGWRKRAAALRLGDRLTEGMVTSCLLSLAAFLIGSAFLPAAYPRYLWLVVGLTMAAALCGHRAPVRREWRIVPLGEAA